MAHHAYVIEGAGEEGILTAERFIGKELGLKAKGNPDVVVLRYGLLSVEEAREIASIAAQGPVAGERKAIIIAAGRAYHEAQNSLLKIFEEPPESTYLFLILPNLGSLLPTLKSRVVILESDARDESEIPEVAQKFLKMNAEKRSALVKRLATGKDEDERRENRDEAIAIVNGIEAAAYKEFRKKRGGSAVALLSDISQLRAYLYDRAASVRMILEHISIVLEHDLL